MAADPRQIAKAVKAIMAAATSSADTPISSVVEDSAAGERVASILVQMGYATVDNGSIRLTESGQGLKDA